MADGDSAGSDAVCDENVRGYLTAADALVTALDSKNPASPSDRFAAEADARARMRSFAVRISDPETGASSRLAFARYARLANRYVKAVSKAETTPGAAPILDEIETSFPGLVVKDAPDLVDRLRHHASYGKRVMLDAATSDGEGGRGRLSLTGDERAYCDDVLVSRSGIIDDYGSKAFLDDPLQMYEAASVEGARLELLHGDGDGSSVDALEEASFFRERRLQEAERILDDPGMVLRLGTMSPPDSFGVGLDERLLADVSELLPAGLASPRYEERHAADAVVYLDAVDEERFFGLVVDETTDVAKCSEGLLAAERASAKRRGVMAEHASDPAFLLSVGRELANRISSGDASRKDLGFYEGFVKSDALRGSVGERDSERGATLSAALESEVASKALRLDPSDSERMSDAARRYFVLQALRASALKGELSSELLGTIKGASVEAAKALSIVDYEVLREATPQTDAALERDAGPLGKRIAEEEGRIVAERKAIADGRREAARSAAAEGAAEAAPGASSESDSKAAAKTESSGKGGKAAAEPLSRVVDGKVLAHPLQPHEGGSFGVIQKHLATPETFGEILRTGDFFAISTGGKAAITIKERVVAFARDNPDRAMQLYENTVAMREALRKGKIDPATQDSLDRLELGRRVMEYGLLRSGKYPKDFEARFKSDPIPMSGAVSRRMPQSAKLDPNSEIDDPENRTTRIERLKKRLDPHVARAKLGHGMGKRIGQHMAEWTQIAMG